MMTPAQFLLKWFGGDQTHPVPVTAEPVIVPRQKTDRVVVQFSPAAMEALPLVQQMLNRAMLGQLYYGLPNPVTVVPAEELLWMRMLLPGSDPEGADLTHACIIISPRQYIKLKLWLGSHILWVQRSEANLLLGVPHNVLLARLRSVMLDVLRRTYLTPWDESWER